MKLSPQKRVKGNIVWANTEHTHTRFEKDINGTIWAFTKRRLSIKEKLYRIWNIIIEK